MPTTAITGADWIVGVYFREETSRLSSPIHEVQTSSIGPNPLCAAAETQSLKISRMGEATHQRMKYSGPS